MLVIPGEPGKITCDGLSRREMLRIGGSSIFGLSLAQMLKFQHMAAAEPAKRGGGP